MHFFDIVKKVESDPSFSLAKGAYLVHGFLLVEDDKPEEWQVGYYNPDKDMITTYTVCGDAVTRNEASEAFKKEDNILPLEREKVVLEPQKALELVEEMRHEKYFSHPVMKRILLLQTLPLGQVYNITLVTTTFNLFNVKLDSENGEVAEEDFSSIMSLKEN